ncbi:DgyrCDS14759 [Dimorphilus gyrociliatus]|uniref:DgyrCDS14759 n=1 Tax=Dimorphilus gyrociliatus TaxID=2664684 RepID=A0A7I8WF19_9ANNE|nr:DgyrCDS14759 [Dimorphilus gyrociliatus]
MVRKKKTATDLYSGGSPLRPVPNGTITGITCSLTAEDEIIAEIGNDVEQNKCLTVKSGFLVIRSNMQI